MMTSRSITWSVAKSFVLVLVAALAGLSAAAPAAAQTVKVTASASDGGTIEPSGILTLPMGSSQTFVIAADTGFFLERIVVDGKAQPPAPIYTFEGLSKNHKIHARFKRHVHTLTISGEPGVKVTPTGTRRKPYGKPFTVNIKARTPGATPSATVDDAPVALTPTKAGWRLVLTVTGDHVVSVLDGLHAGVRVDRAGEGSGTVTSEPPAIDCGTVCAASMAPGTALRLTATPAEGSVFVEWTGACAGSDPTCDLTVAGATTVGARFHLAPEGFAAAPRAEPATGKAPLAVRLEPAAAGATAAIAFYAWDWDGDGTWDSCDPDDPGNPSRPCDTSGAPEDVLYEDFGTYYPKLLVQTVTGARAVATALVHVHGTTSEEKILADLAAGVIDAETALVYRVYADHGDPRLPTRYEGEGPEPEEGTATMDLAGLFDTLSPQTQALLAPFLMPPAYVGSWYDLRQTGAARAARTEAVAADGRPACTVIGTGWLSIPPTGVASKVRVWWDNANRPGDVVAANRILNEVNNVIWPKFEALLGREPLPDNVPASNGCDGGDGLIDLYLVPGLTRSSAPSLGNATGARPAYVKMRTDIENYTVAHEIFHVFQLAYSLDAYMVSGVYQWWTESSAQWAIDHVYHTPKGDQGEQQVAPTYLEHTQWTIGEESVKSRRYGSYVFPLYLADNYTPAWIADIWARMESARQVPFDAIDAVIGGGLEKRWPEFARRAWNRVPKFDHFRRWDSLAVAAKTAGDTPVTLGPSLALEHVMGEVSLPPLSIQYYRYTFPDAAARTVTFYNGLTWNLKHGPLPLGLDMYGEGYSALPIDPVHMKGANIQALLKVGGVWKDAQDWTGAPLVTLCRDTQAERVEEMVLIFSNWDKTPNRILKPFDHPPTLRATNIGCHEWQGESDITLNEGGVITRWHLRELKFRRRAPTPFVAAAAPVGLTSASADPAFAAVAPYQMVAGKLDLSVHGTNAHGCGFAYDLTGLLMTPTSPSHPTYLNVFEGVTSGVGYRGIQFAITRMPPMPYDVTVCCPDQPCTQERRHLSNLLFYDPLFHGGLRLQSTGIRMGGGARDVPGGATSGSWYLDAIRE